MVLMGDGPNFRLDGGEERWIRGAAAAAAACDVVSAIIGERGRD